MIQKKICLLGTLAVGKTSLVRRFVESIYSDQYHTTVGVKVDRKVVSVGAAELALVVWDIEGADTEHELRLSYLRGTSGYLLVADGTRPDTFSSAVALQSRVEETIGPVPFLVLLNKSDLMDQWRLGHREMAELEQKRWTAIHTSAKSGRGVEDAFLALAQAMMQERHG